jgi:enoyl-CoA hydratase/carnithine racemase
MFQPLGEAFTVAEHEMLESLKSQDFKEGVAHFLQKRPPVFTGK